MKVFGKGVCMYGVCVMEECGEFVYHAYVLQGGGGGDETVETGMKLTRSLQSGLEASLSMGSGNGTTRGSRVEVSATYMFWSAEDASSAAMDYRKGNVEEGMVNQAGGGGGRKEMSNSPVCLWWWSAGDSRESVRDICVVWKRSIE